MQQTQEFDIDEENSTLETILSDQDLLDWLTHQSASEQIGSSGHREALKTANS